MLLCLQNFNLKKMRRFNFLLTADVTFVALFGKCTAERKFEYDLWDHFRGLMC